MIPIAPGIGIEERDLGERFVRASGPGGQNVNKVATAVELRFDVARSSLPQEVKDRLYLLAANRISERACSSSTAGRSARNCRTGRPPAND